MSLAQKLSHTALETVVSRFDLKEIGSPYIPLKSPMSPQPVGACRVFKGDGERIQKLVYIGITVPPINLDSHMFFAFTPPHSAAPHFTLDSVLAGPHFAFHLDLIPRVDLGANLDHMNANFMPLSPSFDAAKKIDGLTPAHLSPRQYALMSPWMLAFRATENAYMQCEPHIHAYLDHWTSLVENGVNAPSGVSASDLKNRDQANRNAIFSYEVDPVWNQIERLNGRELNERLISILRNQEVESEYGG
jgi:hypothetical protein